MITNDDIEKLGYNWSMVDMYEPIEEPIILNTDTSANHGVHWMTAIAIDGALYIYDPLGPHNDRVTSLREPIDNKLRKIARDNGLRLYFYPHASQMRDNQLCGYHALYVAQLIKRALDGGIALNPSKIDGAIRKVFGRGADLGDIDVLRRAFE
jgi:hypothetical protein